MKRPAPGLIRTDGNDDALKASAVRNAEAVGAGHTFYIVMRDGFPINILTRIKDVPEVCTIHCATANPAEVIVAETEQGRGILGVVDGSVPKGVEDDAGREWRHGLLRKFGYKR
jgi:adenosine/AMP kinase